MRISKKIIKLSLPILTLILLVLILGHGPSVDREELKFGVTFSHKKAEELGLDWKAVYQHMLKDLQVERIRIAAYWNEVEPKRNEYDWEKIDWQLEQARKHDVEVILAVGKRLPRWPECHFPGWTREEDRPQWEPALLEYIEKTINRYKDTDNIAAWQVENEPFLSSHFGECPKLNTELLDREISLVKELDSRPVVVTDSGELSLWFPAARRADIFGTTMYKNTYSEKLESYVSYPIGPGFFHFKRNIAKLLADPDQWIVIELQGEPWGPEPYHKISEAERRRTMDMEKFREIRELARLSGFKEIYLWGVEYWYWEKEKNGEPQYWEEAKKLF